MKIPAYTYGNILKNGSICFSGKFNFSDIIGLHAKKILLNIQRDSYSATQCAYFQLRFKKSLFFEDKALVLLIKIHWRRTSRIELLIFEKLKSIVSHHLSRTKVFTIHKLKSMNISGGILYVFLVWRLFNIVSLFEGFAAFHCLFNQYCSHWWTYGRLWGRSELIDPWNFFSS